MNLNVHLDHWIIEDGNYEDFHEGETRQFALEYYARNVLTKTTLAKRGMVEVEDFGYQIVAEVVFASGEIVVIDSGILAYSEGAADLKAGYKAGEFVEGQLILAVDPFFYFEWLSKIAGVPPLIYEWSINSIEQDTTPLILSPESDRKIYIRDETRRSYAHVGATNENVSTRSLPFSPYHVLHCSMRDTAPTKTLAVTG